MAISLAGWVTVAIGTVLSYLSIRATLYFHDQQKLMGGSWILVTMFRATATITAVCVWLTAARVIVLIIGPQTIVTLISGLAVVWLLTIPLLMRREFRKHEGR